MSLEPLEPLDGRQRGIEPGDQRVGVDEAEVVRRKRREESHADVGRRRAVRNPRVGVDLHVVGRQMVVVGVDEHRRNSSTSPARSR